MIKLIKRRHSLPIISWNAVFIYRPPKNKENVSHAYLEYECIQYHWFDTMTSYPEIRRLFLDVETTF